jgi:hypothetical protein
MALLLVILVTSVGTAFAEEPSPMQQVENRPANAEAVICYDWFNEPWYSDVNGNDLWEERFYPFPYGGFDRIASSVSADTMLGDIWAFSFPLFNPDFLPATFWPVDVYLWRPPTIRICEDTDLLVWWTEKYWPFVMNPQMPDNGYGGTDWEFDTWYLGTWDNPDGPRRQSWPMYQETDIWGYYYARFMLPRDEVWYPCGYPCKWNCNYYNPWTAEYTWHSPWLTDFRYPPAVPFTPEWYWPLMYPMYWPYKWDWFYGWVGDLPWTAENEAMPTTYLPAFSDPQDTTHPLTYWMVEGVFDTYINTFDPGVDSPPWGEFEILGYTWKTSDLKWAEWPDDWPYLCEDHDWYP